MSAAKDSAANLCKGLRLAKEAARRGAQIVCLPELFRTMYFPQFKSAAGRLRAETIPGESTRAFSKLARELGVVVIAPLYERAPDGRLFNSAAVVGSDGRLLKAYRKVHVPHDPLFYEQSFFAPGDRGFLVYRTPRASFAVLICFDQWFPEAARACALKGAEIIFYPTAIGGVAGSRPAEGGWRDAWVTIQRSHAIANSVHVAAVNRTGREGRLRFWGTSFVCDAFGNILRQASRTDEEILISTVDLSQNGRVREGWGFMRNRRPECYKGLLSRGGKG